ncbi:hypothetical protein HBZS_102920 [Helicobacter bizzozeronii CCUG 35545]|nr:hypothetical protein HBZS_102920 [Helicobacter bizzozeronii CCUG 35545]
MSPSSLANLRKFFERFFMFQPLLDVFVESTKLPPPTKSL